MRRFPASILGVTFTNKASEEMRERIAQLVSPEKCRRLTISTFHAACLKFLRRNIHLLGYKNDFLIYDAADQLALVKGAPRRWRSMKISIRRARS